MLRQNQRREHRRSLLGLCVALWLCLLLFAELLAPSLTALRCATVPSSLPASLSSVDPAQLSTIAFVADPQLTDVYSYSYLWDGSPVLWYIEHSCDVFMRLAYRAMIRFAAPERVFFLGDLMDSPKQLDTVQYAHSLERFRWVFPGPEVGLPRQHFLAGNHDVGYDIDHTRMMFLAAQFERNFGPLNQVVRLTNGASVVMPNTLAMQTSMVSTSMGVEAEHFLGHLPRFPTRPLLLSHVPLWRPPHTQCTSESTRHLREHRGYSYTTMISQATSDQIIRTVQPYYVLSGDDHRQCRITLPQGIVDQTVGTLSWMQGNRYPSYALATVYQPSAEQLTQCRATTAPQRTPEQSRTEADDPTLLCRPHIDVRVCALLPPELLYLAYAVLGVLTVLALLCTPDSALTALASKARSVHMRMRSGSVSEEHSSRRLSDSTVLLPSFMLTRPSTKQRVISSSNSTSRVDERTLAGTDLLSSSLPSPSSSTSSSTSPSSFASQQPCVTELGCAKDDDTAYASLLSGSYYEKTDKQRVLPEPAYRLLDVARFVGVVLPIYLVIEVFKRW